MERAVSAETLRIPVGEFTGCVPSFHLDTIVASDEIDGSGNSLPSNLTIHKNGPKKALLIAEGHPRPNAAGIIYPIHPVSIL